MSTELVMKTLSLIAAGALAAASLAAPAFAATAANSTAWYMPSSYYGSIGYTNVNGSEPAKDLSGVTGRIGAKFGRYLGVEGEVTGGIAADTHRMGGDRTFTHLNDQYAGYVVGFLPITQQFELLARAGYGAASYNLKDKTAGFSHDDHYDTANYGVGAQYSLTKVDALRADYTRFEGADHGQFSDAYTLSYVRKF